MYNKNWYTPSPTSTQRMKMGPTKTKDRVEGMTATFWVVVVGLIIVGLCVL